MKHNYRLLITSISKKIPLLKAARQSLDHLKLNGVLFGADSDKGCIGSYFVDEFWHMPPLDRLPVEEVIAYCKKNKIQAIIPTRDGELPFFAKHQKSLSEEGISCMVSSPDAVETCRDKFLFAQSLRHYGLPAIPAEGDPAAINAPSLAVKERYGAGSRTIGLDLDLPQAKAWAAKLEYPLFQPFIRGEEYSIDCYLTRHRSLHGIISRIRERVENGESQITRSVKIPALEAICAKATVHLEIYGHAVFQAIVDANGAVHLIECNPRFGGASTLSVAMGLASFEWFILESLNRPIPPFARPPMEMRQIRYPEDKVISL